MLVNNNFAQEFFVDRSNNLYHTGMDNESMLAAGYIPAAEITSSIADMSFFHCGKAKKVETAAVESWEEIRYTYWDVSECVAFGRVSCLGTLHIFWSAGNGMWEYGRREEYPGLPEYAVETGERGFDPWPAMETRREKDEDGNLVLFVKKMDRWVDRPFISLLKEREGVTSVIFEGDEDA